MRLPRFKIRTLIIATTLVAILVAYYSHVAKGINGKIQALRILESDRAIAFVQKGKVSTWEELGIIEAVMNWPIHRLYGMQNEFEKVYSVVLRDASQLPLIAKFPCLQDLQIEGEFRAEDLKALQSLGSLRWIEFLGYDPMTQTQIEAITKIKSLRSVKFGDEVLTKSQFDLLAGSGIRVLHSGLIDFWLKENYYTFNRDYFPVDQSRSGILISVDKHDSIKYSIHVETKLGKYSPNNLRNGSFIPSFRSDPIVIDNDWRKLVGINQEYNMLPENYHHAVWVGKSYTISDFNVEIPFRDKNMFHIKWRFYTLNAFIGHLNTVIPLCNVEFEFDRREDAEESLLVESRRRLKNLFPGLSFGEPSLRYRKNRKRYVISFPIIGGFE